jgi:diguanylate cyclase (GGDEF)-like protein
VAFVVGGAALVATASWPLAGSDHQHLAACAIAIGMAVAAVVVALCLRDERGVVAYSLIVFVGLGAIGAIDSSLGTAFSGLLTIAFIYLGLSGSRRGVVLAALPPAVGAWLLANGLGGGSLADATAVRLPIAVVIWAAVGILLARHTERVHQQTTNLQDQALRDPLTSLHNRRALADLSKAATAGDGLVLLDIDHFKSVNDRHGHLAGDTVLCEFAALLQDSLREGDSAVRYGGEEFLLYLPHTTTEQIRAILDRLHARWAAGKPVVTFSAGAATVTAGQGIIEAMGLADRRLYAAKTTGRNRSVIDDTALTKLAVTSEIPEARAPASDAPLPQS